jgi:hypothetical protein
MTWLEHHQASELAASEAHAARHSGDSARADFLFEAAARAELEALNHVSLEQKPRTFAITAVSCAALLYKAARPQEAELFAHSMLSRQGLPDFATDQLREILQSIWNEQAQAAAGVRFVPGQVTVSVDGGEVVKGGAPLDTVLERVQTIQSIFLRTTEFLKKLPLRRRGPATKPIQALCRPWLFQSVPGSYQFTIAIQGPDQLDLYADGDPDPKLVASTFMTILESASIDPVEQLPKVVPDHEYRATFLKLARNLAPTGRTFSTMEIKSSQGGAPVVLTPESRRAMTQSIRGVSVPTLPESSSEEVTLRGVLRAVHLDKDWLELMVDDMPIHITGVGETVDDVIGPMVNHQVTVSALRAGKSGYRFRDIELTDSADEG